MKHNFALIGAAGYIAPRHLRAIKDNGQKLIAAVDKNDSVGVIDSYFPDASFFTEFERFERHTEKLRRKNDKDKIDYVTICSPNYLHDSHIRFALREDAHAICEKPLVLNPWNAEALKGVEKETGKKVFTILQLRLHPSIIALRKKYSNPPAERAGNISKKLDVELSYITPRGKWYHYSWKGDANKSGGVAMNIGIHFFDMLMWIFGAPKKNIVHISQPDKAAGMLELENANVKWYLSIDGNDLPKSKACKTHRSITIDKEEIEFSDGFTELHTQSYKEILKGSGFRIDETLQSIDTVYNIRHSKPIGLKGEYHPMLKKIK